MRLTPEVLFGPTPVAPPTPSNLKVSPDGRFGSYLRAADDDRERLELWLVDMASAQTWRLLSGNETAAAEFAAQESTAEEAAERERRRMFARGVTAYAWHPDGDHILVPAGGAAYLVSVADGAMRRATPPNTRQSGFRLSPKGTFLSFVRAGDLFVLRLADGAETRLTQDGGGTVTNGLAEFIAQEEMARFDGHWWAPDESAVAFARVDTATIAQTHRHEVDAGGIRVVAQRYPHAGGANAEVRLGLIQTSGGGPRWLDWALEEDDYLARVNFAPDGRLHVQAQSRDQKRLALRRFVFDRWHEVLAEQSSTWVNLHDNLQLLRRGRVLWTSEREGSSRLYMVEGERFEAVDTGLHRVDEVLDANKDCVWVAGCRDDPTCRFIARVPWSAARRAPRVFDQQDGWHFGAANAKADRCLVALSTPATPCALFVFGAAGARQRVATRLQGALPRETASPAPQRVLDVRGHASFGTIESDGCALHYRLTKPTPFNPARRYPVVVHVYGGPGAQRVRKEFPPLALQLFAQAGFGVFELDNRGSAGRDKAFEDAIHGRLGDVEVADQLAGVEFLRRHWWVDAERIGIFGHSYGGYMVLMCLASSHAFAAGASVAPVTDWTLYDTHYTERYLGTPEDNPQGYRASAVLPRAQDIDAPLLLMHGMADDNVLFTHTTALMKALQDAGKPFELMTYPGAKHALQESAVAIHRYHCILDFFRRTLASKG